MVIKWNKLFLCMIKIIRNFLWELYKIFYNNYIKFLWIFIILLILNIFLKL